MPNSAPLGNQSNPPPPPGTPMDDPAWQAFFHNVWQATLGGAEGSGGGGQFRSISFVGKEYQVDVTTDNFVYNLLTVNRGVYSNYSSDSGNTLYGFAANVSRSANNGDVAGAQLNAWAERGVGSSAFVYGVAALAAAKAGAIPTLVGVQANVISADNSNVNGKIGFMAQFYNRLGGTTSVVVGANMFNYSAWGMLINAQVVTGAGDFSGWNIGIQFLTDWCDRATVPAWSGAVQYFPGQIIAYLGIQYKAVITSFNQVPAAVSAYWTQNDIGSAGPSLAVGIDFSSLSIATIGKMQAAIKLRETLPICWGSNGLCRTFEDPATGRMVVCDYGGTRWLEIDLTTGVFYRNGVFLI